MSLPDESARDRVRRERVRNVIVEASAGTGKTKLLVDRMVSMLAPENDAPALPIERLAAITFTRKAAGELRLRTRECLLRALASEPHGTARERNLRAALAGIDTAQIGTIHSFADSLLRRWPQQSRLDPDYRVEEATDELLHECFRTLLTTAENGTLPDLVSGLAPELGLEASHTILAAQRAGLRMESLETEHWTYFGLDGLVAGFVNTRDVTLSVAAPSAFDRTTFHRYVDEHARLVLPLSNSTSGERWLRHLGDLLHLVRDEPDPAIIFREVVERCEKGPRGRSSAKPTKGAEFGGDDLAWDAWRTFDGDTRQSPLRSVPLRDDLLAPLRQWMASRIVALQPVVLAVYEHVKGRRGVLDQIDLLLKLRDLLRDRRDVRGQAQRLFDHLFVDEFQDTDPLQAEILLFLTEEAPNAAMASDVRVTQGKLTVIGDPKQSIYRFRRADIATYQAFCESIRRQPCLTETLTSSFRSAPALVEWINERFTAVLGADERAYNPTTGDVAYRPLTAALDTAAGPNVHAVPFEVPGDGRVAELRAMEARAMTRYVRWLVTTAYEVTDPGTAEKRPVRFGDIAFLAVVTTNLPLLLEAFDEAQVPYSARGGVLFLRDPQHRQFLLGLAALADRDDGVAEAALLRPPFFACTLSDLARGTPTATDARAFVRELRRRRFERRPGAIARGLVEETGFGRSIAMGPNGLQRLNAVYELCFQVEARALADGTDFDATVRSMRRWVTDPVSLDAPAPIGAEAVRVLTVHQAKGLEFPVVILWDGCAIWTDRIQHNAWDVTRDGRGWALGLDGLRHEQPRNLGLASREKTFREVERKRLAYVAATRARDLLVMPKPTDAPAKAICTTLLATRLSSAVFELPKHADAAPAEWFVIGAPPARAEAEGVTTLDVEAGKLWNEAHARSAVRRACPAGVTALGRNDTREPRPGRYGALFGETVHRAIGIALRTRIPPEEAVQRAVAHTSLDQHLDAAVEDVQRAVRTLASVLATDTGGTTRLEYPIAALVGEESLVVGYVDLISVRGDAGVLIDFKTDAPPQGSDPPAAEYVQQVRSYASMLAPHLGCSSLRCALLYTANGLLYWAEVA